MQSAWNVFKEEGGLRVLILLFSSAHRRCGGHAPEWKDPLRIDLTKVFDGVVFQNSRPRFLRVVLYGPQCLGVRRCYPFKC